jgi:hypothetical protein
MGKQLMKTLLVVILLAIASPAFALVALLGGDGTAVNTSGTITLNPDNSYTADTTDGTTVTWNAGGWYVITPGSPATYSVELIGAAGGAGGRNGAGNGTAGSNGDKVTGTVAASANLIVVVAKGGGEGGRNTSGGGDAIGGTGGFGNAAGGNGGNGSSNTGAGGGAGGRTSIGLASQFTNIASNTPLGAVKGGAGGAGASGGAGGTAGSNATGGLGSPATTTGGGATGQAPDANGALHDARIAASGQVVITY